MKACDKKRKTANVKKEPKIEDPESEVKIMKDESEMDNKFEVEMIDQESKNDSETIQIQEQVNEMEEKWIPVSEVDIDSAQKDQHTEQSADQNSSYILQSGFRHEDFRNMYTMECQILNKMKCLLENRLEI